MKISSFIVRFVYKAVLFIISGLMCVIPMEKSVMTEPTLKNADTGNYFLPDYGDTLIAAHRLGKGNAPENTLMAIEKCMDSQKYRADIFEMDIEMTSDGQLVLYHSLYLDEHSNAAEYFNEENVTVFSKTYDELKGLNMGEKYEKNDKYPYAGLRGDDIPDNLRIISLEEAIDYIEQSSNGEYRYVIEIKYPTPWAPSMVDKLYNILEERGMTDRVIVASFWRDVVNYIDNNYSGKLMRSAEPFEIVSFYGSFLAGEELERDDIKFMALQLPYYSDDGKFRGANFGNSEFIEYAHKLGISVQFWTVNDKEDMLALQLGGADVIMTNYVERAYNAYGRG